MPGADDQLVPPGRVDALLGCAVVPGSEPRVERTYLQRPDKTSPELLASWASIESGRPSVTSKETRGWGAAESYLSLVTYRYAGGDELEVLTWHPLAERTLDGAYEHDYARRYGNGSVACVQDPDEPPLNRRCASDRVVFSTDEPVRR